MAEEVGEGEGSVDVEAIEKDALEEEGQGSDEAGVGVMPLVDDANVTDAEEIETPSVEENAQPSPPTEAGVEGVAVTDALEAVSDAGTSKKTVSEKVVSSKISGKISGKVIGDDVTDIAAAGGGGEGEVEVAMAQSISEEIAVQEEGTATTPAADAPSVSTKGSMKMPSSSSPSSSQRDQGVGQTPSSLASAASNKDLAPTVTDAVDAMAATTSPSQDATHAAEEDLANNQPTSLPPDDDQPPIPAPTPAPDPVVESGGVVDNKDLEKEAKEAKIRAANEKRAAIEAAEEETRKALEEKVSGPP